MDVQCYVCEDIIDHLDCTLGMNLPGITPGPIHICRKCRPVQSPEEIIESMEIFINPLKEKSFEERFGD